MAVPSAFNSFTSTSFSFFADINDLQFSIVLRSSLKNSKKFWFILCKHICSNSSQFCILSNLVWGSGTNWFTIDIDIRFLPDIEPDDFTILGVDGSSHLLQASLDASNSRLTTAVDFITRNTSEVGTSSNWVGQLLDLLKMVSHGCSLPYLWLIPHDEWESRPRSK